MKILHLSKFYPPYSGGIENVVHFISEPFVAAYPDCEVTVLCSNTGPRTVTERMNGVRVVRAGSLGMIRSVTVNPTLPLLVLRELKRCDVVMIHMPNPNQALGVWFSWLLEPAVRSKPIMLYWHGDVVRQKLLYFLYRPFESWLRRHCRTVVVATRNHWHNSPVLERSETVRLIPYGIPDSPRDSDPTDALRRHGLERDGYLLSVGRLIHYKSFDVLLRALKGTSLQSVIVGRGELEKQLKALAAELGVDSQVRFLQGVSNDDLAMLYKGCRLYAFPSASTGEGFGIVQLEAMRESRAVVNTNIPTGTPLVSLDGETGITVTPGDPDALREALLKLDGDEALRTEYGRAGRKRFTEHFDLKVVLEQHRRLYQELIG